MISTMDVSERFKPRSSVSKPIGSSLGPPRNSRRSIVQTSLFAENTLEVINEFKFNEVLQGIYSVRSSLDGNYIAVGFGSGIVKVLQAPTYQEKCMLKCTSERSAPFLSIRFHPTKVPLVLYASGTAGYIYTGNLEAATFSSVISEKDNEINIMDINSTGDMMATGGKDLTVRFYDTHTNQLVSYYEKQIHATDALAHTLRIFALKFHPDNPNVVITGGWDSCVKIWDRRFSQGMVKSFHGPHICGDALDIKNNLILTGSWVNYDALQLWDFATGKLVKTLPFMAQPLEAEQLYFCQFGPSFDTEDIVYSGGSGTNNAQAAHVSSMRVIGVIQFTKSVTCGHCSENRLAIGSIDNTLKVAKLSNSQTEDSQKQIKNILK